MEYYDRIKSRREELGMSQLELARKLGYRDRSSIAKIEQGVNDLPQSKIFAFAQALNTTPQYLMGWDTNPSPDSSAGAASNIIPLPQTVSVPLVGSIACGTPILAVENLEGYVDMPDHVHADFALRCKGDSMIGARIFDGDIVYIKKQEIVDDGQIAAVLIDDEATLKRVRFFPDHIVLEPANPAIEPLVYWHEEMNEVRIIGLAVAFTSLVRH